MQEFKRHIINFLIVVCFGSVPAVICQFFTQQPVSRNIHIRSFRYGKDPSVIRCNRGDTLHLTFSTDDTGHSFFLEEFDNDAKVSPARRIHKARGQASAIKQGQAGRTERARRKSVL